MFRYIWRMTPADVRFLVKYFPLVLSVLTVPFACWVWYQSHHLDHAYLWHLKCVDPRPWYQTYEFWTALDQAEAYWWMMVIALVMYAINRERK